MAIYQPRNTDYKCLRIIICLSQQDQKQGLDGSLILLEVFFPEEGGGGREGRREVGKGEGGETEGQGEGEQKEEEKKRRRKEKGRRERRRKGGRKDGEKTTAALMRGKF